MGNCLVTKLKTNIQNKELPVLGALRYYIENPDGVYPFETKLGYMRLEGELRLKFDEEINQFTNSRSGETIGSETTLNESGHTYCRVQKAGWLNIYPKYNLTEINSGGNKGTYCRTKDFRGMYKITSMYLGGCIGDINDFDINNNVTSIKFDNNAARGYKNVNTYGDIVNFNKYTELTDLEFGGTKITGNIEDLRLPKLELLNITKSKVFGDIKVLADKMYQAGRRSGTLKIWTIGRHGSDTENVTYNGEYLTKRVWNITFSEDGHSDENTTE